MSDLKITHAGTEQTITRQGPMNPSSAFGQSGSMYARAAGGSLIPPDGMVFIAITFVQATVFEDASSGANGLVAEDPSKFVNTATAGHNESAGSETSLQGSWNVLIDEDDVFPAGLTIYGRWTKLTIGTGGGQLIAYLG